MSAALTLPQARIPIGFATVQGQQVPVLVTMDWMLAFAGLLTRTGGTSGDTNFNEYINQFFDVPSQSTESQQTTRTVEELRHEIECLRSELSRIRGQIETIEGRLA